MSLPNRQTRESRIYGKIVGILSEVISIVRKIKMKTGIELQDKTTQYTDQQLSIVLNELWGEGRLKPGEYSGLAYCLKPCLFLEDGLALFGPEIC